MRLDMNELASLLDEPIEKGTRLERRSSKISRFEEQISKGLSHDPFMPHTMNDDSPYYNPYRQIDGGYAPYPVSHWVDQGKKEEDYLTTQQYYAQIAPAAPQMEKFRGFARSITHDLVKAGAVPVGTVHTYRDGQRYKKQAEGQWVPLAGLESDKLRSHLEHAKPEHREMANQEMERHASQTSQIQDAIKRKEGEEKVTGEAKRQAMKEAIAHVRGAMKHLYDGPLPEKLEQHFKQAEKKHADKKPELKPEQHLEKLGETLAGKKHHVTVGFTHSGKQYEHTFQNVQAASHGEATDKVTTELGKKLKGAQIHRIKAVSVREQGMEKSLDGELPQHLQRI
jgi:hypothetical protein